MQNTDNTGGPDTRILFLLDKLYARLNVSQREAVRAVNGPLLVLAGAGSGKTTVLVNRVYHIINFGDICEARPNFDDPLFARDYEKAKNGGIPQTKEFLKRIAVNPANPENVLCITFTNKAAGEFKERLGKMLGKTAGGIWAGTFHSICARILRKHIDKIGFSNSFTIYDADDSKKLISQIIKDLNIDEKFLPAKAAAQAISSSKENRVTPEEMLSSSRDARQTLIARIYDEYMSRLKKASALDFDDIILSALVLFESHPRLLEYYRDKFDYILVDEYQDTNPSQNDLVLMLGKGKNNVCVVGDDDQSIYSFRGATVGNILNFDKSFPKLKTIKLEQNYRSTQNILSAANALIGNNKGRKGKNLWTSGGEGEKITSRRLYTQAEEAEFICGEIMRLSALGTPLGDIAVLYRVNAISNAIESSFIKNRLPYKIFGGIRFYERKEIKDIVAYLSLISNPADDIRLRRIINTPKRQIGEATLEEMTAISLKNRLPLLEVAKNSSSYPTLARACAKLEKFHGLIGDLSDFARQNKINAIINEVITRTGYLKMLTDAKETDREEMVREFISAGLIYEESSENPTLAGFLEEISLVSDIDDYDEGSQSVSLMTVHSAKGLEFPVVFISAFEEGVFPSAMSVGEGNLEEERRLAYVAITRAKKKLYITHTDSRTLYGFTSPSRPSSFLEEIPQNLLETYEPESPRGRSNYSGSPRAVYSSSGRGGEACGKKGKSAPGGNKYSFGGEPPKKPGGFDFSPGEYVEHKYFGKGKVVSFEKMGQDALIEVDFENGQVKKLMASFAKLEKSKKP